MELRQLRHFLAVAENLSFSEAAEELNLTTQAISKSVRQLELNLGVKVFDRDTRSVALTRFGELLLPHAQAIDAETHQFERSLDTALGAHTGIVRLGATPTALTRLVPETLRALLVDRPTLRIEIELSDFEHLLSPLVRGELDLIVSTAPTRAVDPLIVVEPLMRDYNVLVCSVKHPLAGQRAAVHTLGSEPWIHLLNFERGTKDLESIFSGTGTQTPEPSLVTTAVDFAIDWIEQSNYLSILPREVASAAVAGGRLAEVRTESQTASWPIVLAYRRNATRSPASLALIEALKEEARKTDQLIRR